VSVQTIHPAAPTVAEPDGKPSADPERTADRSGTPPLPWRVGELARRCRLSVRTLHHWDDLGLITPSHRSPAGHRLYTAEDVARLQQIVALRGLGLALTDIRTVLADPLSTHLGVVGRRLDRAHEQLALQQRLCERLQRIAALLAGDGAEVPLEQLVDSVELMSTIDRREADPADRTATDRR